MAIDPNRWTVKTQEAFNAALDAARAANNPEVGPAPLLAALLQQTDGIVAPLLRKVGVDPRALQTAVAERLARQPRAVGGGGGQSRPRAGAERPARQPRAVGGEAGMSRALRDALERADTFRNDLRDEYLSTEHVVLALADLVGASVEELLQALQAVRGNQRVTSQSPEDTFQALEKFGRDLTQAARDGKLD